MEQLAKAYTEGFVHSGEYVKFRKRKHGASSAGISGDRFVVFNLNHDQVGNRPNGERLCILVDDERLKLAAAMLLLSPYVPMLFMGEEYAERSPFYYFVSHSDEALVEAVRKGRKDEFKEYKAEGEPPDPQDEQTFNISKLNWNTRNSGSHVLILQWHKELIKLRNTIPVFKNFNKNDIRTYIIGQEALIVQRRDGNNHNHVLCFYNFSEEEIHWKIPPIKKHWKKIADSRESRFSNTKASVPVMPEYINSGELISLPPLSVTIYLSND